jgi:ATP-dependent RNA circularization protein (DNA/RNA ligase family)
MERGIRNAKWQRVVKADDNAFTQMAIESGAAGALKAYCAATDRSLAVQGEMVGPSIQKNFEGMIVNQYFIYDVYDIDAGKYLLPSDRLFLLEELGLDSVPTKGIDILPPTVQAALADADGPSGLAGKYREGFVYKSTTRDFSFKVISNTYLLKEE